MSVLDSFAAFQSEVNADLPQVRSARERRDLFKEALSGEGDVRETIPSGSLARGTQHDPIHDVDLVALFGEDDHPDWGTAGESAASALDYTREMVHRLLGQSSGTFAQVVRLARWRNHAVKCFLDDPEDPDAFTVDVMPALRVDQHLLIPEASTQTWVECDPEYLIAESAAKHAVWTKYAGTVRMLKSWRRDQPMKIKSLVMEVLAFNHLPLDRSQPGALRDFFGAAAYQLESGEDIVDPAGYSGAIQHDLDLDRFAELLRDAADSAAAAIAAQANDNVPAATRHWADIFGDSFPVVAAAAGSAAVSEPRPVKDSPQG